MIDLYKGDCLEVMDRLIEQGVVVDAIITDVPYQSTACDWDFLIPFNNHIMLSVSKRSKKLKPIYKDEYILQELKAGREYQEICEYFDTNSKEGMWQKLNKLIKPNGAIVLFGSEPFSSALRMSNIKNYKYDWVWEKNIAGNFATANKQPMKYHELLSVFYKKQCNYNKQLIERSESGKKRCKSHHNYNNNEINSDINNNLSRKTLGIVQYNPNLKNPSTILKFSKVKKTVHPTQKPEKLMEYLIKTYTNEGELVLDFTSGSFTTAIACLNTKRSFIGIELDDGYFNIGTKRVKEHLKTLNYTPNIRYNV